LTKADICNLKVIIGFKEVKIIIDIKRALFDIYKCWKVYYTPDNWVLFISAFKAFVKC